MSARLRVARLLRRDVVQRAHDHALARHGAGFQGVALLQSGQSHVEDLDDRLAAAASRQQQIVRLDVAVYQAAFVSVL